MILHDHLADFRDFFALQWFCEVIRNHAIYPSIFDMNRLVCYFIRDKVEALANMLRLLAGLSLAVIFQWDGTHIVLEQ